MTNPGGGKNDIPNRLKRQFFIINMLAPSSSVVSGIYESMITHKFNKVKNNKEIYENIEKMCNATVELWAKVREKFIPTPMKFTYNFTLKDISKIMLGALRIDVQKLQDSNKNLSVLPKDIVVYLWKTRTRACWLTASSMKRMSTGSAASWRRSRARTSRTSPASTK